MSDMHEISLRSFFSHSITGEWGSEPIGNKDVTVFRAADFTKDCKLRRDGGVLRAIPPSKLNARRLENNDILIEKSGGSPDQPVGRAVLFEPQDEDQVAVCSNFIQRMVVKECYEPLFVYYLLLFLYEQNATLPYQQQTTGIINLKLEEYLELQVKTYLDRSVQTQIASILKSVDQQIALTLSQIEKMTLLKQGMMADLFSRGIDPATDQLRPSVHDAPELYQETSIGLLPKEWEVCPLGSISSIASGITLGKDLSKMTTVRVPYLRVANVQDGYLDLTEVKFVDVPEAEATKYLLLYGDVLMNEGGDFDKLGRGAVWRNEVEGCCHQNHVFRVRTVQAELRPEFLAYWSASTYGKRYFILNSKQSTNLASINSTQLKAFPVAKPSLDEQSAIEDRLQSIDRMIDMCQLDVDKLKQQKSGLMRDLLTGKVPVSA
ncbi:restriction endonuclease subunit S [Aeromonas veronii bv. sobria]|uniref:Type I restriction modification DNA specificity domain-containing protein n=1 Tax=Aeromonas veronii TaxID=654 RepID=A0ABY3MQ90_AERVE|nr:restriction endonuclease subunit S [Aeromonas veronii]RDU85533.1 hypothetical protein CGZ72_11095 [Aeromonas veronii]RDU88407.1 hypothetical protein CGZ76_07095 [Aeromonas veronii]TEY48723.1 hypothetical protein CIG14_15575 [Aeromonas veronii]TEY75814.1 hypothetical protein CIG16_16060 [Aeromonas veronii]TYD45572.1 hypothetical protein CJF23_05495 [Aeromonas veronii]